jgi:hypothetical protein
VATRTEKVDWVSLKSEIVSSRSSCKGRGGGGGEERRVSVRKAKA